MTTVAVDHFASATRIAVFAETQFTNADPVERGPIPASIASDQLYYWSSRWQSDEQETLDELARGQGRRFESARDAVRWLLDPSSD